MSFSPAPARCATRWNLPAQERSIFAIESSTLEPQLERVNLVPLLSKVVGRTRSGNPAHKLNTALPQGLTAMVDPQRIEQAIQTLLDHALARCPRGSWIDVGLRRPLVGLARIELRDFGRPASEDTRRRLAEGGESDRQQPSRDGHGGPRTRSSGGARPS